MRAARNHQQVLENAITACRSNVNIKKAAVTLIQNLIVEAKQRGNEEDLRTLRRRKIRASRKLKQAKELEAQFKEKLIRYTQGGQ